jgi:hypothetical protein
MNTARLCLLLLTLGCGGCVAWRSDVAGHVWGRVLEQKTQQPVAGARLYDQRYPAQAVITATDGSFDLPEVAAWHRVPMVSRGPDLTHNRFLIIEAPGYQTAREYMPIETDWPNRTIYLTPDSAAKPGMTAP